MRTSLVLLALAFGLAVCAAQLMNAAVTSSTTAVSTAITATVTFTSTKGQGAGATSSVNLPCFSRACVCSASGATLSQVAATPQVTYTAPTGSCPAPASGVGPASTFGTSGFTVSNNNGPALQSASYVGFAVTASTISAANNLIVDSAGTSVTPIALGGLKLAAVQANSITNAADVKSGASGAAATAGNIIFTVTTTVAVPSGGQVIINLPYNYLATQSPIATSTTNLGTCAVTNTAAAQGACPANTASGKITCTTSGIIAATANLALTFTAGWIAGDPRISVVGGYTVQTMTAGGSIIEGPADSGATLTAFTSGTIQVAPAFTINSADLNAQVLTTANHLVLTFRTQNAVPVGGAFVLTTPVGYFNFLAFVSSTGTTASGTATCLKSNPTTVNDVWTCITAGSNNIMPANTAVTWTSAAGNWGVLSNQAAGAFSVSTQTAQGFVIDSALSSAAAGAPAIQTVGTMSVGAISFGATTDNNPGLTPTTGTLTIAGIASSIALLKSKTKLVFTFPYYYISITPGSTAAFTTAGGAGATGTCSTTHVAPAATCPSTVTAGSTTMTCTIGSAQDWTTATNSLILTAGEPWRIASNTASGSFTLQAQSLNSGIITGFSPAVAVPATGSTVTSVAAATNSVTAVPGDKLPGVTTTGNLVLGVTPASPLSTGSTIVFTLPANYLTKTTGTTFSGVTISTSSGTVACTMAQASAATTCAAAGTTSTISCVTGGAAIPSGAVASVAFAASSWSLAKGATGTYTATTYNNLGLLVDKTSVSAQLITAAASGAVSNVQAAVFSKSTDQVPGLATTTGTLTFTFTTATTIPSGSIAIVFQSQGYLNTVGAFTTTMGSPSGAGPSGSCTLSSQSASCAVGASVATCGVSSAAVAATQTLTCAFTSSLTAGVVTLILTAGTYTVGSSQPASKYTVSTSTGVSIDTASTTMGNLPALAAGAVSAVSTAAFSVAGDMVPGTTSTGTLTFGFTTATDLISGSLILVTLPNGYLSSVTSAKLGTATISCSPTTVTQGCAPTVTTNQLLTCTTSAAVTKGAQSLVLQIGGFVVGAKNAAAGTSYSVATATATGVIIDTAGSGSVPAITAGGSASGSGAAAASVAADLVPGATTTGTLTLAFTTATALPTTGGKVVFSLTAGWLRTAAAATLSGGSPATTSTCSMVFSAGSAASGCTAPGVDTLTCTVGTADLAAGTYNLVLTAASAWSVGNAQPAGTFSVSTNNNGVALDAASTTTGVLPKIGGAVAVTSFTFGTPADSAKIGVASSGSFSIGFTTSTALAANAFILFTLPAANYFSSIGAGAQSMTGQSTTAPTCTWSTPVLTCKVNAALPVGASIISIAAGWTPGATVNAAQFPAVTNSNKATYTLSNLISPAKYLPAATYAANSNYQAYFGTVGSLTECSAALAFPQFGTAPPSPSPSPSPSYGPDSAGDAVFLSTGVLVAICVLMAGLIHACIFFRIKRLSIAKSKGWIIASVTLGPLVWLVWWFVVSGHFDRCKRRALDKYKLGVAQRSSATGARTPNPTPVPLHASAFSLYTPDPARAPSSAPSLLAPVTVPVTAPPLAPTLAPVPDPAIAVVSASLPLPTSLHAASPTVAAAPPAPPATAPAPPAAAATVPKQAIAVATHQLPLVPLSSLPPLTHACGSAGASGCVYKIEYQGRDAAAKEFHKHMHDMLRRELKTLQLLAHPNIVRVLAIITDAASHPLGFVMEYVPMSLDVAMHRMTLRQAVHVMSEAALGVAVAHDAQVVHSDIKPANIMCSEDYTNAKLADFGLAHAITASLSMVSGVRGTAMFIAPELHEEQPPSTSTDVFSFGMSLWQVLHPSVLNPFGTNMVTISLKLGKGERPDFTRADAPLGLKDLVARCLTHDPSRRPASMWEVHRELKAILQQLPDTSPHSTLAALLSDPALADPSSAVPSGNISLADVPMTSDFAAFVRARVRREEAGVSISRICRVHVAGARMATYMDLFAREVNSRISNPMLRPANHTDPAFVAGLNKLKTLFERTCLAPSPPCNIVFAWHGTPAQHVESVCRDGPRAFRTTDGGYFGAGSYFAAELEYATRYAMMQAPSASGEYPVILFAVSVASVYVITPGRDYPADDPNQPARWGFSSFYSPDPMHSVALMPKYNAHFVPVKYSGREHCVTGKPLPLDTDYQAAVEGDATAHELVALSPEQALPVAVVWLRR